MSDSTEITVDHDKGEVRIRREATYKAVGISFEPPLACGAILLGDGTVTFIGDKTMPLPTAPAPRLR